MQAYMCDRCGEFSVQMDNGKRVKLYKRYPQSQQIEVQKEYDLCQKCSKAFMIFMGRNIEEV